MRTVKIGVLVSVALVLFMATVFSLGQQEHLWERKVSYEIRLARSGGLLSGAQVSLTGVPVGSVSSLRFPKDPDETYIEVTISVAQEVAPRIRDNTIASVRTLGLLGDRYIELSAGTSDAPLLAPGGLIASIDPIDYEQVFGQSGDIVANVVEVTASLKTVLQSIERGEGLLGAMVRNKELGESTLRNLEQTMANMQGTTHALETILEGVRDGRGLLGRLTRDSKANEELMRSIDRSAKALDGFTTRLNDSRGLLGRLVDDEAYARKVLTNLDRTLANLAEVAEKIDQGDGTLGRLVNDPSLYEDTRKLLGGARGNWLFRLFGFGGGGSEDRREEDDR